MKQQTLERRSSKRVSLEGSRLKCDVEFKDKEMAGEIVNISYEGACIILYESKCDLKEDDEISISFRYTWEIGKVPKQMSVRISGLVKYTCEFLNGCVCGCLLIGSRPEYQKYYEMISKQLGSSK